MIGASILKEVWLLLRDRGRLISLFALPELLSLYYVDAMTQVAVYAMVALGLGLLVGRVGLVSLGQVAGPLIAGMFADARGNYRAGFTLLALLAGSGSVLFLLAHKPEPVPPAPAVSRPA